MNKSAERAHEIIELYLNAALKMDFIDAVYLVGSLSDGTYTGNAGSDIDLVHIVSDSANYNSAKAEIIRLIGAIEQQTDRNIPISRVVYQKKHLVHPYVYDFELTQENMDLVNRPIEVFRILDSGKLLLGEDVKSRLERPTREDVLETERLNRAILDRAKETDPEFFDRYTAMRQNPDIRMMTQIVLTTAMSDYFFYTDKSCSSKYHILERIEEDIPDFRYLNLLRLCHKNRFTPDRLTEQDKERMVEEYKNVFLTRPETWK